MMPCRHDLDPTRSTYSYTSEGQPDALLLTESRRGPGTRIALHMLRSFPSEDSALVVEQSP